MAFTIVKVQVPIDNSGGPALVYDAQHNRIERRPITDEILRLMGGAPKKFIYAEWIDGTWVLGSPAPWQEW